MQTAGNRKGCGGKPSTNCAPNTTSSPAQLWKGLPGNGGSWGGKSVSQNGNFNYSGVVSNNVFGSRLIGTILTTHFLAIATGYTVFGYPPLTA